VVIGCSVHPCAALERRLHAASETVIMLWRDTHDYVRSQGMNAGKIVWIPHVIDAAHYAGLRRTPIARAPC
jgi:hypothetical protein